MAQNCFLTWIHNRLQFVGIDLKSKKFRWRPFLTFVIVLGIIAFEIWAFQDEGLHHFEETAIDKEAARGNIALQVWSVSSGENRTWDTPDLLVPSHMSEGFFLTTAYEVEENQKPDRCAEDYTLNNPYAELTCNNDSDCQRLHLPLLSDGVRTGRCVAFNEYYVNNTDLCAKPSNWQKCADTTKVCEINAWCPVHVNGTNRNKLRFDSKLGEALIFVKASAWFPRLKQEKQFNYWDSATEAESYTVHCYDKSYCPKFTLQYILDEITPSKKTTDRRDYQNSMLERGAIIGLKTEWDCDLDRDDRPCNISYSFSRLDNPEVDPFPGYSVSTATYWNTGSGPNAMRRNYYRYYGLLFQGETLGTGVKATRRVWMATEMIVIYFEFPIITVMTVFFVINHLLFPIFGHDRGPSNTEEELKRQIAELTEEVNKLNEKCVVGKQDGKPPPYGNLPSDVKDLDTSL